MSFFMSCITGLVMSRLEKNSGTTARIVKYMSSFRLHFSKENLHPRRNVIILWSSEENYIMLIVIMYTYIYNAQINQEIQKRILF